MRCSVGGACAAAPRPATPRAIAPRQMHRLLLARGKRDLERRARRRMMSAGSLADIEDGINGFFRKMVSNVLLCSLCQIDQTQERASLFYTRLENMKKRSCKHGMLRGFVQSGGGIILPGCAELHDALRGALRFRHEGPQIALEFGFGRPHRVSN